MKVTARMLWVLIRGRYVKCTCGLLVGAVLGVANATGQSTETSRNPSPSAPKDFLRQPLSFQMEPNAEMSFIARGPGYTVSLSTSGLSLWVASIGRPGVTATELRSLRLGGVGTIPDAVRIRLTRASPMGTLTGERELPGRVSNLIGSDASMWKSDIPTYAEVRDTEAYPGIDLVYYGNQQQLEFDFDITPGANPQQIALDFENVRRLALDRAGDLEIAVGDSSILLKKPTVYQDENGEHKPIRGRFRLLGRHTVGFALGHYDHSLPLVIDPILTYSTYLGSASNGSANAVAVDSTGNAYVTGSAMADFPTTTGAFQSKFTSQQGGGTVAFVSKFDPNGNLIYSTYLGGSVQDGGNAIAVDGSGNAYIAGYTSSPDFPVTSGAFQTTDKVSEQPGFRQFTTFVAKLNPSGTGLVYSTFLGGSTSDNPEPQTEGQEQATGIAIDSSGNAYVAGFTYSTDFPTTAGAFQTTNPGIGNEEPSFFVSKLNPSGSALEYSTYIGGEYFGSPPAIAVDSAGSAYIAGGTAASDYPTTAGAFNTNYSATWSMAVVTKLNATGTGLMYSTFLGGNFDDFAKALAVDGSGSAYVTGQRLSNDFPVTPGTIQGAAGQVFFTKLNPSGTALTFSGDMGLGQGLQGDYGNAIAVDSDGNVYLAGQAAASGDFPSTPGAFQTQLYSEANGVYGSFFAKLNSTATTLDYLTYLSGSGTNGNNAQECDCINGMAVDPSGNAIVVGQAVSADFPTTLSAFEPGSFNFLVNSQATNFWPFVTKFNAAEMSNLPSPNMSVSENANPQFRETPAVFTATVKTESGSTVPTGSVEFSGDYGILCDSSLDNQGTATCSTTDLTLGPNPVRVAYYGDQNNAPATQIITETIEGIPTTTTLSVNPATVTYGTSATVTAQVTANTGSGIPTSAVIFSVPCADDPSGLENLDSTGHAICNTSTYLPPGAYSVTANYTGDPNYGESTSAGQPLTVQALGIAPAPTFSPAGGTFMQQITVAMSDSAASSTIYYTTDGSTPTVLNGNPYSAPFAVNSTETVQAIAVVPGYTNSSVTAATYTFPPDFTLALSPTSLSLTGTQAVTSTVTIGSEFGFNAQVSFSCSGLPAGTSCSFSPSTVTGNPQQSVNTTLTISGTSAAIAESEPAHTSPVSVLTIALGAFVFGVRRRRILAMLVVVISAGILCLSACGGSGGSGGGGNQIPITAQVTVTGNSGGLQNTAILTVTYTP